MEAKDKLGRSKEGRDWAACFSVVSEGVGAWGWVQVVGLSCIDAKFNSLLMVSVQEPAPAPYVEEMKNASQFWANRVTKQFKETCVTS